MTSSAPSPSPSNLRTVLSADLPASLVVFLVALPLCMGIALASGAPIMSGLIAGIVGGLVVGALGGAPLLVSGPAAGLSVMVFGYVTEFGFAVTTAAVVVAGVIQMVLGSAKVARTALAISPAVIHGMLAGIGVVIVLGQLHVVLGGKPQANALLNIRELPAQLADLHGAATILGLATLGILLAWPFLPKKLKSVPAALAAVLGATVVAGLLGLEVPRVQIAGSLFQSLHLPSLPAADKWVSFAIAAVSLAIVASAESLLSAVATDKLHGGSRANLDKELFAQGAANTLSGLAGGLPITGVIVRSAANINAGAKTKWSAIMHAVWMLVFVSLLGWMVEYVPLAVLAGLLVHVGAKLVQPAHMRELRKRGELTIYLVTLGGVVFINLLAGIGLGLALAALQLLWRLGRLDLAVDRDGDVHRVTITGALSFVGVPRLSAALSELPPGSKVELNLAVDSLDHAAFETLEAWVHTHEKSGGRVYMEPLEDVWHRSAKPHGRKGTTSETTKEAEGKRAKTITTHDSRGIA